MPAVRIEDDAFGDTRYEELAEYAGLADADHARGKMARIWRQCTQETLYSLPAETVARILGPNGVDALIRSRLGERQDDGSIRVRGTKGRIEWLKKLRSNGKFGKRGGRPTRNPRGYPDGFREQTPLATATALVTAPVSREEEPPLPPKGGTVGSVPVQKSKRRGRPTDASADESAAASRVLAKLTERTGIAYTGSAAHVGLIVSRLREGITERELRGVALYCWSAAGQGWELKPEMHKYMRPETLFGPQTIHRYLPGAKAFLAQHFPDSSRASSEAA